MTCCRRLFVLASYALAVLLGAVGVVAAAAVDRGYAAALTAFMIAVFLAVAAARPFASHLLAPLAISRVHAVRRHAFRLHAPLREPRRRAGSAVRSAVAGSRSAVQRPAFVALLLFLLAGRAVASADVVSAAAGFSLVVATSRPRGDIGNKLCLLCKNKLGKALAAVPEDSLEKCRVVAPGRDDDAGRGALVERGIGARADQSGERGELGAAGHADTEEPTDLQTVAPLAGANEHASDIGHPIRRMAGARGEEHDAETALAAQRVRDRNVGPVAPHDFTRGRYAVSVDRLVVRRARYGSAGKANGPASAYLSSGKQEDVR